MDFDNEIDLLSTMQKDVYEIISNEVSIATKELEQDIIKEEVLDKYIPNQYERRYDNGIDDIKNMKDRIIGNGNIIELEITNETKANRHDYRLDEVIEEGKDRYEYPYKNRNEEEYTYLKPRPFTELTQEKINNGGIDKSFEQGLYSKGIEFDKI